MVDKTENKRFVVMTRANGDTLDSFDTRVEADELLQKALVSHPNAFVGDTGVSVPSDASDEERAKILADARDDKRTASEIAVEEAKAKEAEDQRQAALNAVTNQPAKYEDDPSLHKKPVRTGVDNTADHVARGDKPEK